MYCEIQENQAVRIRITGQQMRTKEFVVTRQASRCECMSGFHQAVGMTSICIADHPMPAASSLPLASTLFSHAFSDSVPRTVTQPPDSLSGFYATTSVDSGLMRSLSIR